MDSIFGTKKKKQGKPAAATKGGGNKTKASKKDDRAHGKPKHSNQAGPAHAHDEKKRKKLVKMGLITDHAAKEKKAALAQKRKEKQEKKRKFAQMMSGLAGGGDGDGDGDGEGEEEEEEEDGNGEEGTGEEEASAGANTKKQRGAGAGAGAGAGGHSYFDLNARAEGGGGEEEEDEEDAEAVPLPEVDPDEYENVYEEVFKRALKQMPPDMKLIFDPTLADERRAELFNYLNLEAAEKYAWCVPDERALKVLAHFAPIVEIGAGKGYWGYALLRYIRRKQREAAAAKSAGKSSKGAERKGGEEDDADADFIPAEYYSGFDIRPFPVRGAAGQKGNKGPGAKSASSSSSSSSTEPHASKDACAWMEVKKGGPAVLRAFSSHSLFLCYPDEFTSASPQSLALAALNAYKGNTVIVAGELLETGTLLENPWGRACDGEFQQQLRATFHKVLQVPLPSWPGSIDALTVWRRTELCEVDDMTFKNIPEAERISLEAAAPCCRQFLSPK